VDDSSNFFLRNASNLFKYLIDDGDIGQDDHEDLLVPIKILIELRLRVIRRSSRIKKLANLV
jgi:hypothetical protein